MANLPLSVEELFEAVLDLPAEKRCAFLDRACYNQPVLRRMTEELLAEDALAGSFLAEPIFGSSLFPGNSASSPIASRQLVAACSPRFEPNHVIAHRFVVVRFLARGGMGEVYEVEDLWLHGARVALKVIRPEIGNDELHSRRFEQEVLLARKVTHANLCPIYEIFRCDDPAPPFLFLTMKLLVGDTLGARLRSSEVLSRADRELVCAELISAVAALHAGGIIHRDIKPGNVMLETTVAPFRVALMDFGLARLREAEPTVFSGNSEFSTGVAVVAGTPGYLAPELLRGDPPTEASDLFALGVVLHQVLTRSKPLPSEDGRSVVPSPSLRACNASGEMIHVVEALLAASPDRRQRAFANICHKLSTQRLQVRTRPQLTRRALAFSAAAAVCTLAAASVWKHNTIEDLFHPLPPKRFVALLSWPPGADVAVRTMLNGLLDAITNELTRAEALDHNFYIVPQTSSTEVSTPAQLDELRQSVGANLVLAVSGSMEGNLFRVLLQVMEPSKHHTLRNRTLETARDHLFSLPATAVRAASELLDLNRFHPDDRRSRIGTENHDALVVFQTAEALRNQPNDSGMDAAIEQYRLAVDIDPHFAQAHARLAGTYLHLYGLRLDQSLLTLGRANAETALVLDPNSVPGHTALGAFYNYTGLGAKALEQMALALAVDPTNVSTMLTQAQIYTGLDRWQEAEQAFRRLLRARPNDWSAYNQLGECYSMQARYTQALAAFQAATTVASRDSESVTNTAATLFQLGRTPEALATINKSLALARTGVALQVKTDILRLLGRNAEALDASREGVQLSPQDSLGWLELGDSYAALGHRTRQAMESYAHARALQAEQMQANPADGSGWMLLALFEIKSGDASSVPSLLVRSQSLGANDIDSQLVKLRILELLGDREQALLTLAACARRGVSAFQLQATPDLADLRADSRYAVIMNSPVRS